MYVEVKAFATCNVQIDPFIVNEIPWLKNNLNDQEKLSLDLLKTKVFHFYLGGIL